MKRPIYYRALLFCAVVMACFTTACNEEEYAPAEYEYVGLNTKRLPASVFEGTAENTVIEVPVHFGGAIENNREIQVTLRLDENQTTAALGKDFLLNGGTSPEITVTIPANSREGMFTITSLANTDEGDDNVIKMDIVENSANLSTGYPFASSYAVVVQDDDCAFELSEDYVGEAAGLEEYSSSSWGPYAVNFTQIDETTLQMDNFWDWGAVFNIYLNPADLTFDVPAQDIVIQGTTYTGVGTGVLSPCTEQIILNMNVTGPGYDSGPFTITYSFGD